MCSTPKTQVSCCDACFFDSKTKVCGGCDLPTVTEKDWAKLGPKFTFLKCPTFTIIAVISLWKEKTYFPTPSVGIHSSGPTLSSCSLTDDLCHHPTSCPLLMTCVPDLGTQNSHQKLGPTFSSCRCIRPFTPHVWPSFSGWSVLFLYII